MTVETEGQEGQENEVLDENVEESQTKTPEYTEVEQEAMAQGWVPKDQWNGTGKWRDAEAFLDRGELFAKIDSQGRELKHALKTLDNLKDHYTKVNETAYNNALADLKRQHKLANREGDYDRADIIENQIETVERQAETFKQEIAQVKEEAQEIHPDFAHWVNKNPWYASQPHMRVYADEAGKQFQKQGLAPAEVLKAVDAAVRKEFPNKFTNPRRDAPGSVENANSKGSPSADAFVLTEKQTRVMNNLISQKGRDGKPLMTKAEYIADLKKIRGIA